MTRTVHARPFTHTIRVHRTRDPFTDLFGDKTCLLGEFEATIETGHVTVSACQLSWKPEASVLWVTGVDTYKKVVLGETTLTDALRLIADLAEEFAVSAYNEYAAKIAGVTAWASVECNRARLLR
jgi:hypothetical protein